MSNWKGLDPTELWGQVKANVSQTAQGETVEAATKMPPAPKLRSKEVQEDDNITLQVEPAQAVTEVVTKLEIKTTPATVAPEETALSESRREDFHLDQAERLMPDSFPHPPGEGMRTVPATIPNIQFMLQRYGIIAKYNVIKKAPEFVVPGLVSTIDNADSVAMAHIKSLGRLNGISVSNIEESILAIADRNQYNPVANWILSKPWDGQDRLQGFYDTLTEREDFPKEFKERLVYRWGLSVVAAVFEPIGFRSRGVLTFQGPQGIGKTSWIAALISDSALRESVVKLDHHLDAGNKDSQIAAATHLLVEIAELEGCFKRDVARLKGFITSDCDKIRLPYARTASNFPRRNVFCATVNDANFLVDTTGNTRWWVIPLTEIDYQHNLDMQQVWAQLHVVYEKGEQWWLTPTEEQILESLNRDHRVVSVVEERVLPALDLSRKSEDGLPAMTPTELLMRIGYKTVTNPQAKECAAILREHLGEPKKINGYHKWRVPMAKQPDITSIDYNDY